MTGVPRLSANAIDALVERLDRGAC